MRLIQSASYLMPWSTSLRALAHHSYLWTSQEPIAASTSTPVCKVSNKLQTGCLQIGLIQNRWRIEVHRLGFGAMRITGPRVWGRDPVPESGRRMDARIACASKPSRAVIGLGSSKSDYGSCTA